MGVLLAVLPAADPSSSSLFAACPTFVRRWRAQLFGGSGSGLWWAEDASQVINVDPVDGLRIFTRAELARYDGSDPALPLLLGMYGDVFDVTEKGSRFYGPGMAYSVFAGKDGTRALTLGSLDPSDIERAGDVSDFDEQQTHALLEQHRFYKDKYPTVGRLAK